MQIRDRPKGSVFFELNDGLLKLMQMIAYSKELVELSRIRPKSTRLVKLEQSYTHLKYPVQAISVEKYFPLRRMPDTTEEWVAFLRTDHYEPKCQKL